MLPAGLEVSAAIPPEFEQILTHEALALVARLERELGRRRRELLQAREARQADINAGRLPDFLPES